ncbi:hypothetical protein Plhal703r1_c08g0044841 [Plasmopara halstedii]
MYIHGRATPVHLVALVKIPTPTTSMGFSMDNLASTGGGCSRFNREEYPFQTHTRNQEAMCERLANFAVYEQGFLGFLSQNIPTLVRSPPPQVVTPSVQAVSPVMFKREMNIAIKMAQIRDDLNQAAFAMSHLDGHAKDWG